MVIFRGGDGKLFYLVTIIPFCSELILIRDQWITSDAIVWSDKRAEYLVCKSSVDCFGMQRCIVDYLLCEYTWQNLPLSRANLLTRSQQFAMTNGRVMITRWRKVGHSRRCGAAQLSVFVSTPMTVRLLKCSELFHKRAKKVVLSCCTAHWGRHLFLRETKTPLQERMRLSKHLPLWYCTSN